MLCEYGALASTLACGPLVRRECATYCDTNLAVERKKDNENNSLVRVSIPANDTIGLSDKILILLINCADVMATERDHCHRAFEAFQALVEEQCLAIAAFEEQHRA